LPRNTRIRNVAWRWCLQNKSLYLLGAGVNADRSVMCIFPALLLQLHRNSIIVISEV